MKACFAVLCVLLAASAGVQGRRLLVDEGCADLSVLAAVANTSDIQKLIVDVGLLPGGVPADRTIFLPSDEGVAKLLAEIPFPGITVDNLLETVSGFGDAAEQIINRLVSALLYHIVPGSQTAEQLLAFGTLPTELANVTLTFGQDPTTGDYTVTDATGAIANVVGEPVTACGSTVFVIDQVLKPDALLSGNFPLTTLDEALAILGEGGAVVAAPTPAP